ncbi:aryl-sulfate sulfotransferase [Salsipaludibacter albus]|uniref:aryl-sulfate sulfotransferase n=1 Tax=Salsipaludibacter albus TaxID=2849650 RepID=UPI001EE44B48|nr:aryl-sulfate sulfotransferase [Salsipaludibacter albus]MBY5161710.1 aryl-sulfate sulfotransferase [Salsipaludibacter albus]
MVRRWRTPLLLVVVLGALVALAVGWYRTVPSGLRGVADDVAVTRDPDNAIRGTVSLTTSDPSTVEVRAVAPGHQLTVGGTDSPATSHDVPLLGLLADTTYDVAVTVRDAAGDEVASAEVGTLVTTPLPLDQLPPITVDVSQPERMSPGLTLFNSIYRPPVAGAEPNTHAGYIQVVDAEGRIVWYHNEPGRVQQLVRDDDGNFLFGIDEDSTRLIAPTGEVLGEWRGTATGSEEGARGYGLSPGEVIDLDVHSTHHETLETEDGNYVTLTRVVEEVAYPDGLCESSEPGDVENIVGDAVVVFDPADGQVLQELSFFDAQDVRDDPRPVESDYCSAGYLDPQFPEGYQPRDWTHANAVIPIDDGDTWLVSNRHTDSLWALRAVDDEGGPAGSLRWEVGVDTGWEMVGDGRWFWHQHAPELQDDGTILLYDNGNLRDDAPEPYSRAVRYAIDPEAQTIEQLWEHRMDPDVYASFVGDADRLDIEGGGHSVLITHGGQTAACELPEAEDDTTFVHGQLVEVDEATNDIVWQLTTRDDEHCEGWGMYRAERIPSLYPPGWDVTETFE